MGKRSTFPRKPRDQYDTPPEAVLPLLGHLPADFSYWEPCAGSGALVDALRNAAKGPVSWWPTDVEPRRGDVSRADALGTKIDPRDPFDYIITNPPWPRPGGKGEPTLSMIRHFAAMRPTWLLIDADFAHNRYFASVAASCVKIVSVGRVSWEGNGTAGKQNSAWYLFDARNTRPTRFYGRAA